MREPLVVHLHGRLDGASASRWRQTLARAAGHDLTLHMADVTFVDSSFLHAVTRLVNEGRKVTIVECPPEVARVMPLVGHDLIASMRGQKPTEGAEIIPFPPPQLGAPGSTP